MNENIDKIKSFCQVTHYTGNASDEYLFTANCVDYYFFNKNMGQTDFIDGITDGANDGGIDFIWSDGVKLYLIQGKSSSKISYNDIREIFDKMLETYNNLMSNNYFNYSDRVKNIFLDKKDVLSTDFDVDLVLFTNGEITDSINNKFINLQNEEKYENFTLNIYDKNDIDSKVLIIDQGNKTVSESSLMLDSANNFLEYQDGKGAIFSIKASSLKTLYGRYKDKGLFGYNLREHIKEKKVDSAIDKTINNKREDFWYLNNGITIACSDYDKDGNKLKLWNFSIINGAQTTYKIGNASSINENCDFNLVCKVIKSENSLDDKFIRNISEASNSQKPIRPRDIRANGLEQQMLQQKAMDNGRYQLAIEIKRGVRANNYRNVDSWQRVTNEHIGQLLLACDYQQPGTARSQVRDIFDKEKIYNLLFSNNKVRSYNYNSLYDMVRIAKYYDDFKINYSTEMDEKIRSTNNENEQKKFLDRQRVCKNGKFVIIALLFYFYKRHFLNIPKDSEKIYINNIDSDLTLNYDKDNYNEKLNGFFEFAVRILSETYDINQVSHNLTSHSNFFKTDSNYSDIIIPAFEEKFEDVYDKQRILDYICIFEN